MTIRWHTASDSQGSLILNSSSIPSTMLLLDIAAIGTDGTRNSHAIQWTARTHDTTTAWTIDWRAHALQNANDGTENIFAFDCRAIANGTTIINWKPMLWFGWGAGTGGISLLELGDDDWDFTPGDREGTNESGRYLYINGGLPNGSGEPGKLFLGSRSTHTSEVHISHSSGEIGFFGTAAAAIQTVPATSPSVQDLINALLLYGLILQSD